MIRCGNYLVVEFILKIPLWMIFKLFCVVVGTWFLPF